LPADGSGPTVGTPNGIVDQADYTFWRANFGAIGVPNGGLGSGSGSGAGENDGEAASAALVVTPAATTSTNPPAPDAPKSYGKSKAVDAAVAELTLPLHPARLTGKIGTATQANSIQETTSSVDALLMLLRSAEAQYERDGSIGDAQRFAESSGDEVDEVSGAFEAGELLAVLL
jgi:hypothetical protein